MRGETQLLLWITGVHVLGFVCVALLIFPALRDSGPDTHGQDGGSDDGWGNLPAAPPKPSRWPGGGIPLPDAVQSRVRLREPGSLRERLPTPQRRPVREPDRRPVREPGRRPVRALSGAGRRPAAPAPSSGSRRRCGSAG